MEKSQAEEDSKREGQRYWKSHTEPTALNMEGRNISSFQKLKRMRKWILLEPPQGTWPAMTHFSPLRSEWGFQMHGDRTW